MLLQSMKHLPYKTVDVHLFVLCASMGLIKYVTVNVYGHCK